MTPSPHTAGRAESLAQHYREVRARLGIRSSAPVVVRVTPPPAPPPPALPEPRPILSRDYLFIRTPVSRSSQGAVWKLADADLIVHQVSEAHRISVAQMKGKTRAKEVIAARFEAYYRLSTELGYSLPMIGKAMGGKEHTGVMHGVRRHKEKLEAAERQP